MPRTDNRNLRPQLQILSRVKSNVHMCNEAVLVRLRNGKNSLRYTKNHPDVFSVVLNDAELCRTWIPGCGTCSDALATGYGIENLNLDELFRIRDSINGEYPGLARAVQNVEPLLGLLRDGLYLIADYEMYPVLGSSHFWNGDYGEDSMLHKIHVWVRSHKQTEIYDSPAYLFPSQSPKQLNENTLNRYISRMTEGERFPRAIAYYLSGCVALLLDGHHKAAAAAYIGQTVKCLVIFHVKDTNGLVKRAGEQRLFLNSCEKICRASRYEYLGGGGGLILCGKDGTEYGDVCTIGDVFKYTPEEEKKSNEEEVWKYGEEMEETPGEMDKKREKCREIPAEWGKMPDKYCGNLSTYPKNDDFSLATIIPRNKILEEYFALMENSDPESNWWRRRCLISYYEVFPEQKWITEAMYIRLKKLV